MKDEALTTAIAIAGGTQALARLLGITREAVTQWKKCPAHQVLAIEKACGGKVSRADLRPDLYPPDEYQSRKK